jgi:hypothetical protein
MNQPTTMIEYIARAFHEAYEVAAPKHGYETREASRTTWEAVPEVNKNLMIAVVQELIEAGVIAPGPLTRQMAEYRSNPPTPREQELAKAAQNVHPE